MIAILIHLLLWMSAVAPADNPSADTILDLIDKNMMSETRVFTSRMIVHGRRGSRTMQSKSWQRGDTDSFTEYLAPAREKGTKMLKLGDQLWLYSPDTDRTIRIAGHMLRQSMMGSDLSYEDMMEEKSLRDAYSANVIGKEEVDGRECWVLELLAIKADVAYYSRKIWVDSQRYLPLKSELYAKSGTLLKRIELGSITRYQGRWYPKYMHFKDMLKTGKGTEFIIDEIKFDTAIPKSRFSKASLRR